MKVWSAERLVWMHNQYNRACRCHLLVPSRHLAQTEASAGLLTFEGVDYPIYCEESRWIATCLVESRTNRCRKVVLPCHVDDVAGFSTSRLIVVNAVCR